VVWLHADPHTEPFGLLTQTPASHWKPASHGRPKSVGRMRAHTPVWHA
jgi:hypothetical protein